MFTGLIEEIGKVRSIRRYNEAVRLVIQAHRVLEQTHIGDSIAVQGICLTVTDLSSDSFAADVMPETLRRTSLGQLEPQSPVNLERALRLGDRLGGHLVSGHIDGTGYLARRLTDGNALRIRIDAGKELTRYIIEKGSVALDGVSLTVVQVDAEGFEVSLIPHTADQTCLGRSPLGTRVNIECDPIGKYVEKLLQRGFSDQVTHQARPLDWDFLRENGF